MVRRMIEAQANFESAVLEQVYAPDYIEISPVGEVDERPKAIGFYRVPNADEANNNAPFAELSDFDVRNYGNHAIVIAKLTFRSKDVSQKLPAGSMRVVLLRRKLKDVWKISSAQFTGIRPHRPQPAKG